MTTDFKQITTDATDKRLRWILKLSVISVSICALSVLIRVSTARAQTQIFTAIPPRLEVSVKPGEFVKKTIQFRNEGEETAYLSVLPKDFIVRQTNGAPEFVATGVSGRWSAASWMRLNPSSLAVPPKATVNVVLSVTTPLDALPGGHYAGVLYQSSGTPLRLGTGVGAGTGVTQVVGTLVYLTVAGPVKEEATLKRFEAPAFLEYGPVEFTTEILNQSDLHITPKGQITVRNLFGSTSVVLPLEERNVFPSASLIFQNTWNEKNLVGRFRADFAAAYGSGRALTGTIYFWVFPWKAVTVIILTIILVILLITLLRRQIKRREEELEEKLEKQEEEIEELKTQIKHREE